MKELERLSDEELLERVFKEVRQLKIESGDKRWNGMQRDLVSDIDRDASELARRYKDASGALDQLSGAAGHLRDGVIVVDSPDGNALLVYRDLKEQLSAELDTRIARRKQ